MSKKQDDFMAVDFPIKKPTTSMVARPSLFSEISDTKKRRYLSAYVETGNHSASAAKAGVTCRTTLNWRKDESIENQRFLHAFEIAEKLRCDRIDDEIYRRAVNGWHEPVFYQGEQVGEKWRRSDVLLIFAAKAMMPEKYRERYEVEHNQPELRADLTRVSDAELRVMAFLSGKAQGIESKVTQEEFLESVKKVAEEQKPH